VLLREAVGERRRGHGLTHQAGVTSLVAGDGRDLALQLTHVTVVGDHVVGGSIFEEEVETAPLVDLALVAFEELVPLRVLLARLVAVLALEPQVGERPDGDGGDVLLSEHVLDGLGLLGRPQAADDNVRTLVVVQRLAHLAEDVASPVLGLEFRGPATQVVVVRAVTVVLLFVERATEVRHFGVDGSLEAVF